METHIAEIAPSIYRLSTYVEDDDFMYNQFLVVDEEPLLFHTGLRAIFPLVDDQLVAAASGQRLTQTGPLPVGAGQSPRHGAPANLAGPRQRPGYRRRPPLMSLHRTLTVHDKGSPITFTSARRWEPLGARWVFPVGRGE